MEPLVLEITPTPVTVQRKYRIGVTILQAAFWTIWMFVWKYVSGRQPSDWTAFAVSSLFGGVIFGLAIYFVQIPMFFRGKQSIPARASIVVDENQAARCYQDPDSTLWIPQIVVRKGKVRSIFKIVGGVGVSERSQFGARMLGFLAIPNTLPKFEEVKALLESWRVSEPT